MDLQQIFAMGASLIEGNSDSATTGMDTTSISQALGGLLTHGDGSLDITSVVKGASSNGLGDIISSWLSNGSNLPISKEQITTLLGEEKIAMFASSLGISMDSAKGALTDSLPQIVNNATNGEMSIVDEMMKGVGGNNHAMGMLGKIFG